jgi:hypothetical protein
MSPSWVLLNLLLILSFVADVAGVSHASSQDKKIVRQTGSGIDIVSYNEIPEATEPCTPEESEWWKRLRQLGNDLQKKRDEKTKKRFYLLIYEGQQKAYRIPLKDRPPQRLVFGNPTYNRDKYKVKGTVELSVEFRADSSVGDIQIISGLGPVVDESVIHATRQTVFLPAIKAGAFVTQRGNIGFKFWHQ